MKVRYRLDVDYMSKYYDNSACFTSEPIYTKKEGLKKYMQAKNKTCIDDPKKPARVHLWKYNYNDADELEPITIARNY